MDKELERRKKISETKKRLYSEGKIKPYWLNKQRPSEFGKRISEALTGRKISEETIKKQREVKLGSKNPMFGRKHTDNAKEKVRIYKLAEKNPNWQGDNVKGKDMYHSWLRKRYSAPKLCENCHEEKKLMLASINGHNYTRNIKDYKYLCPSCHKKFDRGVITICPTI